MSKIKYLASSICFLGMLIIGCNEKESYEPKSGPRSDTVVISQLQFHPGALHINKGDTVVWVNHDIVIHDVTSLPDKWSSGNIPLDGSWSTVITEDWDYYCDLHPTMKGEIVVE